MSAARKATMLDHALAYAADGCAVFPCAENGKEPACQHGVKDATTDPDKILALWRDNPNLNIGFDPHSKGWCVVDIDGQEGENSLFAFELDNGQLPETREHSTPGGGRHLLFLGALPPTASKIGPGLDTRGNGSSYILVPPSIVAGKPYVVTKEVSLAPVPKPIVAAAGARRERIAAPEGIELDQRQNISRAINLAKRAAPAIEGQGGDAATYALAAEIMSLGISPDKAFEIIAEHYNPRCGPPWSPDELRLKIENAERYAQNDPGAFAVPPVAERIPAPALEKLIAESSRGELPSQVTIEEDRHEWHFDTFNAAEDANLPPITYHDENKLWPRVPGGSLTQIIAQAKGYKTTFYLSELFRLVAKELKAASE